MDGEWGTPTQLRQRERCVCCVVIWGGFNRGTRALSRRPPTAMARGPLGCALLLVAAVAAVAARSCFVEDLRTGPKKFFLPVQPPATRAPAFECCDDTALPCPGYAGRLHDPASLDHDRRWQGRRTGRTSTRWVTALRAWFGSLLHCACPRPEAAPPNYPMPVSRLCRNAQARRWTT